METREALLLLAVVLIAGVAIQVHLFDGQDKENPLQNFRAVPNEQVEDGLYFNLEDINKDSIPVLERSGNSFVNVKGAK